MASEPIRDKKHVRQLSGYYLKLGKLRNYFLIIIGIYTALRISDLLCLTWGDLYDFDSGKIKKHITLKEQKTGKSKAVAINKKAAAAAERYLRSLGGLPKLSADIFIFQNNRAGNAAIGRVQAWRIVKEAADALRLGRVSCHSLRKTFGYHAWKSGALAPVLMDIYNHSSYEVTRRYLGITQDDRDEVYLKSAF